MSLDRQNIFQDLLKKITTNTHSLAELQPLIASYDFSYKELHELYLAAVNTNVSAIMVIPKKMIDETIAFAAIKQASESLEYIPTDVITDEMVYFSIQQDVEITGRILTEQGFNFNKLSLKTIYKLLDLGSELSEIRKNIKNDNFTKEEWTQLYQHAIQKNFKAASDIPKDIASQSLYEFALKENWRTLKWLPKELLLKTNPAIKNAIFLGKEAIKNNWSDLLYIPDELIDDELYAIANQSIEEHLKVNSFDLYKIPRKFLTENMCLLALSQNISAAIFRCVPTEFLTQNFINQLLQQSADQLYDLCLENKNLWQYFIDGFNQLSADHKDKIFETLAKKYHLAVDIKKLKDFFKAERPNEIANFEKMIENKNPEIFFIMPLLIPFLSDSFQAYSYTQGLLVCAEVANRKSYVFNPTVLHSNDFQKYLEIIKKIKDLNLELRERFCLTGGHWRVGDIEVKNKNAKVLLIDPMGVTRGDIYNTGYVFEKLSNDFITSTPLFFDKTKKQYAENSCSVFSLDDLIHLFKVENFLPDAHKNLFDYFESQNKTAEIAETRSLKEIKIIPADLPLYLLRNMQHKKLRDEIIPNRKNEKDLMINKKRQTALQNVKPFFEPEKNYETNTKLEKTRRKIANRILTFLTTKPLNEVIQSMEKFTLEAFLDRMVVYQNINTNKLK